jgi:hypothetical protein
MRFGKRCACEVVSAWRANPRLMSVIGMEESASALEAEGCSCDDTSPAGSLRVADRIGRAKDVAKSSALMRMEGLELPNRDGSLRKSNAGEEPAGVDALFRQAIAAAEELRTVAVRAEKALAAQAAGVSEQQRLAQAEALARVGRARAKAEAVVKSLRDRRPGVVGPGVAPGVVGRRVVAKAAEAPLSPRMEATLRSWARLVVPPANVRIERL